MIVCQICFSEIHLDFIFGKFLICSNCGNKIHKEGNLIFFHNQIISEGYDPDHLNLLLKHEEKHFWFIIRRKIILNYFKKYISINSSILELGAGTGSISKFLINNGYKNVFASDIYPTGFIENQRKELNEIYIFDINNSPFEDHFDTIGLFDVVEHFENDVELLLKIRKIIKPNGKIVLTVPACKGLWSKSDELSGHKRRYNMKELTNLLIVTGYTPIKTNYFFSFIFPFLYLKKRVIKNTTGEFNIEKIYGLNINPILNQVFNFICVLETFLSKYISFNFGGSIIVIAKKNDPI